MKKSGRFNSLIQVREQKAQKPQKTARPKPAPARSAEQGSAEGTDLRNSVNTETDKLVTVGAKVPHF